MSEKLFDYAVSNPPYQQDADESSGNQNFKSSLYCDFIDKGAQLADCSVMVHPARFLFEAGAAPKAWVGRILADEHFKVLEYEADSKKVFRGSVDIKGGICITMHDASRVIGPVGLYVPEPELQGILDKVMGAPDFEPMSDHMHGCTKFDLDRLLSEHPEVVSGIGSDGRDRRLESNIMEKVPLFTESPTGDDLEILAWTRGGNRVFRFIPRRYVLDEPPVGSYKVILPKSNGSGNFGEVLSTPVIGTPVIGYTRTFLSIGSFDTEAEAEACLKYVKSKFMRAVLGARKRTQDNPIRIWGCVGWQDFTSDSDIDWSQSVADIDRQLYAKYGLTQEEIDFIETNVREME